MDNKKIKLHPGKRKKHGGFTYLTQGTLPENRRYIERHLTAIREGLIRDLGPQEQDLTTAQAILIDRVVTKMGVVRCIEEYIRENTVLEGKRLAPALRESYLKYSNSITTDLRALGIKRSELAGEQGSKFAPPWDLKPLEDKEKTDADGD